MRDFVGSMVCDCVVVVGRGNGLATPRRIKSHLQARLLHN